MTLRRDRTRRTEDRKPSAPRGLSRTRRSWAGESIMTLDVGKM